MKKMTLKTCLLVLPFTLGMLNLRAQTTKNEVQIVQGLFGMQKRAIIDEYLKFSPTDSLKFDPVYNAYSEECKALGADRITIIEDYAKNYTALTNEKADELIQKLLKNNADVDKLQLKYYGKLKNVISPLQAAKVMQLEIYMQTAIRAEVQNQIPVVGQPKVGQ